MSDTRFTPGPWWVPPAYEKPGIAVAVNSNPHPIATAYFVNGIANARLIATAPELYGALERLVKRTPFTPAEGGITVFLSFEQIRQHQAALAKARGDAA